MKPAISVPQAASFAPDMAQQPVFCLRCTQRLERYQLTSFAALANGMGFGQAMLVCPHCGHVEFVAEGSPLLSSLQLASVDTGDGD